MPLWRCTLIRMLMKLNGLCQLLVCVEDANLLDKTYTLQPALEVFTVSGQKKLVPKCSYTINICYSFIRFPLKSIFNIRSITILPPNKFFTDLIHICSCTKIWNGLPVFNLFPTYNVQYDALGLYIYYLRLFSTWITGTEKQLTVNLWKCRSSNDVTLFVLPFHSCISHMRCVFIYVCIMYILCMYVCMYVCIHVFLCMYVCIHVCLCMYACMYVCVCVWPYVSMYACIHVFIYVCMYLCMC
jgi:nuclear pore complex protein Nup62